MKIQISILQESPPPAREKTTCKAPSLDDKIQYALDCIEVDDNKEQAIAFLRKVYHATQKRHPYTDKDTARMDKMASIFNEYGITFDG